MAARGLMIQGTGSDCGKSLIVAGLCRAYARRGLEVRPFKAQNMSNNAAVAAAADGGEGEIGRAQALQARAAGVEPHVDMNPVLLKPESERRAQIVVSGRAVGRADAREYARIRGGLRGPVLDAFRRLASDSDLVLAEGAGSASEINLRAGDIANMGFAEDADLPVVLVADVDRGGVVAAVAGTRLVLPRRDAVRLRGYVVNRFRGDPSLFEPAVAALDRLAAMPCLGIVPWFDGASALPAEDSMALEAAGPAESARVAVPRFPRISNFDDLDPLAGALGVRFVAPGSALPGDADLVVLPGSKNTRADLAFLRAQGWDIDLRAHCRRGGMILGLCGGYQMLGRRIADPDGVEGGAGESRGLGMLDVETVLTADKVTRRIGTSDGLTGYEIHTGRTWGPDLGRPFLRLDGRPEGAVSADGTVFGTYCHGLFASDRFRDGFLARLGEHRRFAYERQVDATLDALADHLEAHLDLRRLLELSRPVDCGRGPGVGVG